MLFSSISFLYYFLPCVIIAYFILPFKLKNLVLFLSSMVFYFYGEPKYIILMLATILVSYIFGLLIDKFRETKLKKVFFVSAITLLLASLGVFKYSDFAISNINNIFGANINLLKLALPIGISFYTFQILSYVIDVYWGKVKVQKNILKLATYVSLFPQLIAGPIVRYETVEEELSNRTHSFEKFSNGVTRFVIGLAKKILIANALGELCSIFLASEEQTVVFYWMYGIAYSMQIYFDFSAYSDMAIGLGRIFGFTFLENFDYPYISKSITEFWRRWHISLGSWFRDYVYIPLGGNRVSKIKLLRNIFIVWFLTGMWHGANWTFIVWGLMFGIILTIEKFGFGKILEKIPTIFRRIYVLFIVMISFIIFNSENMSDALNTITGLFGANGTPLINDVTMYYLRSYLVIFILGIIGATPIPKMIIQKLKQNTTLNKIVNILEIIFVVALLFIVTAYLVDNSYNPFLYFRF
ncbi:MAG: MBOAT family protein [Clostridiales bacterium]|nr:MBOAT family protein [Clostridiales bacterium]